MRAPAFWWRRAGGTAALLRPAAAVYGAIAGRRLRQPGTHVGVPVVCIGNPTLGGAGKTPTALALANLLAGAGEHPVFLSRGYGGRLAGPVRVDAARHLAADVGDEPLLLARAFPTVVARDRVAGAAHAADGGASVVVMDDGFQNPSLVKDCAILVVDAGRGIGNGLVFPAGPLRAPLMEQIAGADAVLVIGSEREAGGVTEAAAARGIARFGGNIEPDAGALAAFRRGAVLAFAGIGDPGKFFATLTTAGIDLRAQEAFADHHAYSEQDAARLLGRADRDNLTPVTTEKDFVRLAGGPLREELRARAGVLPIKLVFDQAAAVRDFVLTRIRSNA